jgi:glycosyltransferase involved in cell wall biosynthesis
VFIGGWLPPVELVGLIGAADLGVIPYSGRHSLNHRLCTPNKLFEFIEAGLPICANDLPELRRIVAGSGIGHVAPMESAADIANAIGDARARAERGCFPPEAFERAGLRYGWARQESELLGLYERLGC